MFSLKKILFTDLFGTLVSPNSSISKEFFGNIDREFCLVCQYINEFLRKDNYVAIVTEPGGHGDFGTVFNNRLSKLNSYIADDLRSHIVYYLQGNEKIIPQEHMSKKNINGKIYYIGDPRFKGILIDKKEKSINDFLQMVQPPYQIYGIGDSDKDIPMLLKVEEIGGKSSIMDTYLYRYSYGEEGKSADEVINNQLDIEFKFQLQQARENNRLEGRIADEYSEQEILLLKRREQRKYELYQLLYKGELDLDKIKRDYSKHLVCSEYKELTTSPFSKNKKLYESYPFSEEIVQSVMNMSCYCSFSEYYTKVLKRN